MLGQKGVEYKQVIAFGCVDIVLELFGRGQRVHHIGDTAQFVDRIKGDHALRDIRQAKRGNCPGSDPQRGKL
jgi:hypothetical protein